MASIGNFRLLKLQQYTACHAIDYEPNVAFLHSVEWVVMGPMSGDGVRLYILNLIKWNIWSKFLQAENAIHFFLKYSLHFIVTCNIDAEQSPKWKLLVEMQ